MMSSRFGMKFQTTYISLVVDSIDNTISAELPLRAANVVGITNISWYTDFSKIQYF